MSEETKDTAEVKAKASKLATFWERAKVTVIGVSILLTVLTAAYFQGDNQGTIINELSSVKVSLTELKASASEMKSEQKETNTAVTKLAGELSAVSERTGKLEVFKEAQVEAVRLFWAKDWPFLVRRIEEIEHFIFRQHGPVLREAPPR